MTTPFRIVIVGGGTAGWMSAAALASFSKSTNCQISLVESEEIASVGVGEATLPQMKHFNDRVGIDEAEMMRQTHGTFKLGIKFKDWGALGNSYVHPFGQFGGTMYGSDFHQHWARLQSNSPIADISTFSYAVQACNENRFEFPSLDGSKIESTFSYAYHFDASLYAAFLRKFSVNLGVERIEGKINQVTNHADNGSIKSVTLENGKEIAGDFFIDCSGFRSLLLAQNLKAEFDDWSKWLVCDRAFAVPSDKLEVIPPYTQSTAKAAGWQWKIPLQHRTGNGYVYSSNFISGDQAAESLLKDLTGSAHAEPKMLRFKAGRYKKTWDKNCVAIGLASGFLEPLESSSIYLIQMAITYLLRLFPDRQPNQTLINEYNRLIDNEYERIRDFLILHYHLNQRDDSELWRYCRNMPVPDTLTHKIDMFKRRGFIDSYKFGLFNLPSWTSVFHGQGLKQDNFDPFTLAVPTSQVEQKFKDLSKSIKDSVEKMSSHNAFIAKYCAPK